MLPTTPDDRLPRRSDDAIPSLTGLRSVSIILVIAGHAAGFAARWGFAGRLAFDHATLGVRLFFVISGYLITTLLLRERAQTGGISLSLFYARRALRILPAFYAFVICIVVLRQTGLITLPPHNLLYVLTYTVNFLSNGVWWTGHLWSLSVEEQFYLLWPLALRYLSIRTCVIVALMAVVAGVAIRVVFAVSGVDLLSAARVYAFPFVSGTIAMGCLLAIGEARIRPAIRSRRLWSSGWTLLAAAAIILVVDARDFGSANRVIRIGTDLLLTFVVARVVYLPSDRVGAVLNSRFMVFVGALSYSLYLWQQLFFQHYTSWTVTQWPWNLIATVSAASLSYFLLERPLLRWRQRLRPRGSSSRRP